MSPGKSRLWKSWNLSGGQYSSNTDVMSHLSIVKIFPDPEELQNPEKPKKALSLPQQKTLDLAAAAAWE